MPRTPCCRTSSDTGRVFTHPDSLEVGVYKLNLNGDEKHICFDNRRFTRDQTLQLITLLTELVEQLPESEMR